MKEYILKCDLCNSVISVSNSNEHIKPSVSLPKSDYYDGIERTYEYYDYDLCQSCCTKVIQLLVTTINPTNEQSKTINYQIEKLRVKNTSNN